jgi:TonB family protein
MLNRRIALIAIAFVNTTWLVACQEKVLTPTEVQAVQTANSAYKAYERGDCTAVRKLTDPDILEVWEFNEKRHSMLLLQGFCREIEGDISGARDIYRELVLEAPTSFAADDAAERTRILMLIEQDPDYAKWTNDARERIDPKKRKRTPIDRIPVEFPPLAKATGVGGYAIVEFGITQRGNTEDPIIVESKPPFLFDGASLRAVRRWQYMRESSADGRDDRELIRLLFTSDGSHDSVDSVNDDSAEPSDPQ